MNEYGQIITYTYDGSFEGFLSTLTMIFDRKARPDEIVLKECVQYRFDQEIREVITQKETRSFAQKRIRSKLGSMAWTKVRCCFCACDEGKETLIYRYLSHGFSYGRSSLDDLSHPDILPIEKLYRSVGRETERMLQFTRFAKLPEGIYMATVNPKHSVIPLVMDHFAARFNIQRFIIYDENHHIAGLSENGGWYLADATGLKLPTTDSDDLVYQHLWQAFYRSIAIPERRNDKVRMQFMPKRLWKNLTEMQVVPSAVAEPDPGD